VVAATTCLVYNEAYVGVCNDDNNCANSPTRARNARWVMEGEESGEGEPNVGERRRRLTLAPRPWATAHHGEAAEKVRPAIFAGPGGSDDVWGKVDGERSAVSVPCSSVGSTSELRSEFARVANGSRFWVLDGEDYSDGETNLGELLVSGGDSRCASARRSCSDRVPPRWRFHCAPWGRRCPAAR
jgi:hypothetical protein